MAYPIPDAALETHMGILGKVGTGKSYTARGLVERLLDLKRHVVIVDPTGAWYGLRTGYEIPIFGGRHGDIEISDQAGGAVAGVIAEQRASAIVDLSLLSGGGQRRFMRDFAHRLRAKEPGAIYLVLDEADEFLPQNLQPDMTNLFGDLKWMVRRGRLNGFRVMMITQRPAEIAKAVLTQIETLVAHRLTAPQDRKAIEEWVKGHHDPAEAREVLNTLASLDKGEAWVWAPDLGILSRSRMPPIKTFDSGRTPEAGEEKIEQPSLGRLDLSEIRSALLVVNDPTDATVKNSPPSAELSDLRGRLQAMTSDRDHWRTLSQEQDRRIRLAAKVLGAGEVPAQGGGCPEVDKGQTSREGINLPSTDSAKPQRGRTRGNPQGVTAGETELNASGHAIPASQQKVLNALAWWESIGISPVARNRASIVAGLSPKASTFGVYVSKLSAAGLVDTSTAGHVALTEAGRAAVSAIGDVDPIAMARTMLPGAAASVFDRIADAYPGWISRDALADQMGLSRTASTLGVYISKAGALGFVETRPREVKMADWLMP